MRVSVTIKTQTGHRLLSFKEGSINPQPYPGKCGNFHGHTYTWVISVEDSLNLDGMVVDFRDLKKMANEILEPFDHAMVLCADDPLLEALPEWPYLLGARTITVGFNPTAENLAQHVAGRMIDKLQRTAISLFSVRVQETETNEAEYVAFRKN